MKALGVCMQKILWALIILAASPATAFDVNLKPLEIQRLQAEYLVDDLSVGVKAIVDRSAFCVVSDQLYVNRAAEITDKSDYYANYELMLRPDGSVEATLVEAVDRDFNSLPFPSTAPCDKEEIQELGFYRVNTIEGADNFAEFISAALGMGYTIGNSAAAKELKPASPVIDTYANIFSNMYSDKLKSEVSPCLLMYSTSPNDIANDATITIGVDFERDGRFIFGSMKLINNAFMSDSRAMIIFQMLRRAFIKCQGSGFELPNDSYDNWKSLQITYSKSELFAN